MSNFFIIVIIFYNMPINIIEKLFIIYFQKFALISFLL